MTALLLLFLGVAWAEVPAVPDGVVVAAPEDLSLKAQRVQGKAATVKAPRAPEAVVDLDALYNRHWSGADMAAHGGKSVEVSLTFDLDMDAYLSVKRAHWPRPLFYKLEMGMAGAWRMDRDVWAVNLDVSIFRAKVNNYIVMRDRMSGAKFYRRRIRSVMVRAFRRGEEIVVGGKTYRVFFSYDLDDAKSPAEPKSDAFGVILVHDADPGGDHDFDNYIVPHAELKGGAAKAYKFHGEQEIVLQLRSDGKTLEFYAVTDAGETS